ncbi:MAG: hypothetical protein R6U17_06520 [Thermoplasmata archaeon]
MKNKKIAMMIATILLISLISAGCVENEDGADYIIVTDMEGRTVEIPEEINSIVALGSGCMRLIAYMDATEYLAGVEEYEKGDPTGRPYALANPQLADMPSVGAADRRIRILRWPGIRQDFTNICRLIDRSSHLHCNLDVLAIKRKPVVDLLIMGRNAG